PAHRSTERRCATGPRDRGSWCWKAPATRRSSRSPRRFTRSLCHSSGAATDRPMVGRRRITEAVAPLSSGGSTRSSACPASTWPFIGPGDLVTCLSDYGEPDHSEVLAARAAAEEAGILRSKVLLGGVARLVDQAKRMVERGYRVLVLGFDWSLLQRGAAAALG